MRRLGATVVDTDTGDPFALRRRRAHGAALRVQGAGRGVPRRDCGDTSMRTLADLIAFNTRTASAEMKYFGQEMFEMAEETSGDLTDPAYLDARALVPAS